MQKQGGLRTYLTGIADVVLPEPGSQVTIDFVEYVAESAPQVRMATVSRSIPLIGFNFFIRGDSQAGFDHLEYGLAGTQYDVRHLIPLEIFNAGLAMVPFAEYQSPSSKRIMVATIERMIEAIHEYRTRHPSIRPMADVVSVTPNCGT